MWRGHDRDAPSSDIRGIKKISPEDPVGLAIPAAAAGIAVYAAHTTADKVLAGVSGAMARRLGLEKIQILVEEPGGYGLGAVGNLPQPMEGGKFIEYVKSRFGLKVVRCSHVPDIPVRRVAMCGGSGGSLIEDARKADPRPTSAETSPIIISSPLRILWSWI